MSLKRNTPSLKGKKKQKKPPYSHLCGQRFVNLCFLGKHEVNWIIVFLWSSAGLLRNQNANVRFSPAALLLSNPQNKTKETMIVILCRLPWCYVIQFSWEKSVRQFPKKKTFSWKFSDYLKMKRQWKYLVEDQFVFFPAILSVPKVYLCPAVVVLT